MAKGKKRYTKLGIVRTKADDVNGSRFIALGNTSAREKKYQFSTAVKVMDADGNTLALVENGLLALQDPRDNPNLTSEQVEKIPDWLKFDIVIIEDAN